MARCSLPNIITSGPTSPLFALPRRSTEHHLLLLQPSPALQALQTPSRSVADTGSDAGGGAQVTPQRWDDAFVDVEATTELLLALREKMAALNGEIQKEMGTGASELDASLALCVFRPASSSSALPSSQPQGLPRDTRRQRREREEPAERPQELRTQQPQSLEAPAASSAPLGAADAGWCADQG